MNEQEAFPCDNCGTSIPSSATVADRLMSHQADSLEFFTAVLAFITFEFPEVVNRAMDLTDAGWITRGLAPPSDAEPWGVG